MGSRLAQTIEGVAMWRRERVAGAVGPTGTRASAPAEPATQRVLRIDLSTLAICHSVPAGSAVGLGVGYRLFTGAGVIPAAAVMTKATQASARRTS